MANDKFSDALGCASRFSTGLAIAPMRSQAQNLNLKISEPSNSSISVQS
ncbi:MAG: hypothetical protein HC771_02370, partial [Synechococcales cyanobacterium CRU_2_2]|nr:hypothetical protein [Synechococcales cyanobacterium CRU_2_2]